ncbi:MAG: hypothetical protein ACTHU0_01370 [Kofleriaceae bacterium]
MTITAVDSATDQLTIAAHGLLTGHGPAAIRNIGGAHPSPLAPVTDYWIIRVDANTIRLATSSSNALAGTAINLTTNGTGTNILEIGIPFRRARTYVPSWVDAAGAQLKSDDLNAMQDSWKAMHALLTGQSQNLWGGITLPPDMHVTVSGAGRFKHGKGTLQLPGQAFKPSIPSVPWPGYVIGGLNSGSHVAPIILPLGARLLAARISLRDSSAPVTVQARVNKYVASTDSSSSLATSAASSGTGAYQTLSVSGLNEAITSGTFYSLWTILTGAGSIVVHGGEIDWDMP